MRTSILRVVRHASVLVVLLGAGTLAPADEVLWRARNIPWSENTAIKGARTATLWNEGALHRVPINMVLASGTQSRGAHIFVLLGAISVEIAGEPAGEYGPGSFVSIPASTRYQLTTTAAGECTFLLQPARNAAGRVLTRARDISWRDTPDIKGAKHAEAWPGAIAHRLPINMVLASKGKPEPARIVVWRGAVSLEIAGKPSGEFGPGSFISVPANTAYQLTATAAGECTFLLQ
jgi:quercetin dioxygenase-like cupin family protein